jgi:uncharacterized protein (DUF2336 family)
MPRQQMQPVKRGMSAPNGADDDVGLDFAAVGEARRRAASARRHRDAAHAEPDLGRLQRAGEHVEQIGAVHREVRRAERLAVIAAAQARNVAAALPGADHQEFRARPDRLDLRLDAERTERLDGVRREVKPGADFAVRRRLFANHDFGAAPLQGQRRGKPANAAADNGNAWRARHSALLPFYRVQDVYGPHLLGTTRCCVLTNYSTASRILATTSSRPTDGGGECQRLGGSERTEHWVRPRMGTDHSLIAELEHAMQSGSKDRRVDTLRRITDLFVADADRLNDRQIDVFDDVLGQLIKRIEGKALAELSRRLGPISNAPLEVVRRLARDDNITVAAPILTQSSRLSDDDLIEIANTKAQAHLLAISGRSQIGMDVTDVLLQRGDALVHHKLAENSGARFSDNGFDSLVKHSESDERLAEKVGLRLDIPLHLFRELLLRATEAVRSRLLALAGPESRNHIQRVLALISEDTQHEAGFQSEHDYAEAYARALAMQSKDELSEAILLACVKMNRWADMIATLSLLCGAPMSLVQSLLQNEHREAFLIPCKAAGLEWPTVRLTLTCRFFGRAMSDQDLDHARADYFKLSKASAQRVLRFWQVRQTAAHDADGAATSSPSVPQAAKSRILASG